MLITWRLFPCEWSSSVWFSRTSPGHENAISGIGGDELSYDSREIMSFLLLPVLCMAFTIKCFLHCISTDDSKRWFEVSVYHLFIVYVNNYYFHIYLSINEILHCWIRIHSHIENNLQIPEWSFQGVINSLYDRSLFEYKKNTTFTWRITPFFLFLDKRLATRSPCLTTLASSSILERARTYN